MANFPFATNQELILHLINSDVLKSESIREALNEIDRIDFIKDEDKAYAYLDAPLSIGHMQTISQPTTVVFMLEHLNVQTGNRVLDIGSGSGWTTALLAQLVGKSGEVIGLEIHPQLVEFGTQNIAKQNLGNAKINQVTGTKLGIPGESFDRILVSASGDEVPQGLVEQLRPGGKMVIPVQNSIHVVSKSLNYEITTVEFPGFSFVPLIVEPEAS